MTEPDDSSTSVAETVRSILTASPEPLNAAQVFMDEGHAMERTQVYNALSALVKRGEVIAIDDGGKRKYRLAEPGEAKPEPQTKPRRARRARMRTPL